MKSNLQSQGRQVEIVFPDGKTASHSVPNPEEWASVVEVLKTSLKPGLILALSGPLGAGKTTFVQALSKALGAKRSAQSPTFALMRSYSVNFNQIRRIIHVDAYRIEDEKEFIVLDLDEELADKQSILVLEWPENVRKWVQAHRAVRIAISTT